MINTNKNSQPNNEPVKFSDSIKEDNGPTARIQKPILTPHPENMDTDSVMPKKRFNLKLILGVVVLLLILIGAAAGLYLSQTNQELRQQAYVGNACTDGDHSTCLPWTTPGVQEYCVNSVCTTTAPPVGPLCPNPPNLPIVWCATFNCPNGDTTGDGECNVDDDGASYSTGGTSCPNPSSGCGQVDYYSAGPSGSNWGAYCGHTFLDFDDCGGSDPECGDGNVDPGEQCDDGNSNNDDSCRNDCTFNNGPECGDGVVQPPEQCDDGNTNNDDACANDCTFNTQTPISCDNFTGTLKTGPFTDLDTNLSFNVTYSGDGLTKADLVVHGSFTPPAMNTGWATMANDPTLDGSFTGTLTYRQIVDALVATGHDRQRLLDEGITYFANIHGPDGFCTGAGTWSGTGQPCTINPVCNGTAQLPDAESKTWNITTNFVCPDEETIPSEIGRRLFWLVWPPEPKVFNYNPKLDFGSGSTTSITQSITVGDITPGLIQNIYVGLVDASYFHTWWDDGDDDIEPYKAIASTSNPGVEAGDFFEEPMFRFAVTNNSVPTNMTLTFEAPEELCVIEAPMCRDVALLDVRNGDAEINPTNPRPPLYKGQIIAFRCAADDPASQIDHYEFKITEDDGTIITGSEINPIGSGSRSLDYTIPSNGTFGAQCKVCTSETECQPYIRIGTDNTQITR